MSATEMNDIAPMPDRRTFSLQMEGLFAAVVYCASFIVAYLAQASPPALSVGLIATFLIGVLVIPTAIVFPLVTIRRSITAAACGGSSFAAAMPLAGLVGFLLQALLVWWATGEAYRWVAGSTSIL